MVLYKSFGLDEKVQGISGSIYNPLQLVEDLCHWQIYSKSFRVSPTR